MRDLYGKRKLNPNYLTGEMDEFHEAYKNKNAPGIDEEMQDVIYALHLLKHQATRKNFPIVGADDKIKEFYRRKDFFNKAFQERNVPFHTDYLAEGSNPLKPHKIQRAFELAGHSITPEDAVSISKGYQPMTSQKIAETIIEKLRKLPPPNTLLPMKRNMSPAKQGKPFFTPPQAEKAKSMEGPAYMKAPWEKEASKLAALVMEKVAVSRWREAIYSGELPTQEAENLKK